MKRIALFAIVLFAAIAGTTGCTDFERSSFQALSASKSVLDTAQNDYEPPPAGTGKLPHSQCVFTVITDAKATQKAGVDALLAYDAAMTAKTSPAPSQTAIVDDLAKLATQIASVKALYSSSTCTLPPPAPAPAP